MFEVLNEGRRDDRLIFVGGAPRSGTTMVQNILDSHPDICGGPEFDRVPDIVTLRNKLRSSVESERISAFCAAEDIDREVGLFIERLLLPYAEKQGCGLISEKTPWNALVFRELLEIFPRARFIFCVRDPRAVVSSMLEVGKRAQKKGTRGPRFTRTVYSAVNVIKNSNEAGFDAAEFSDRVLTMVYERLVVDPEEETKRLCDFLGVTWSAEMLRSGEKKHEGEKVLDGIWYDREMYNSNPDPGRMHGWQKQLSPIQRVAVSDAFSKDGYLKRLNYEISEKNPSASSFLFGVTYNKFSIVSRFLVCSLMRLARRALRG